MAATLVANIVADINLTIEKELHKASKRRLNAVTAIINANAESSDDFYEGLKNHVTLKRQQEENDVNATICNYGMYTYLKRSYTLLIYILQWARSG